MSSTMVPQNSVIKLSRFRADVARALSRRGRHLMESENLEAEVAALAPLEAYFIIKELGVDDALPMLHYISDEQFQTCIDLDCWDGDTFCPIELDAWLAAFNNDGAEALATAFLKLDEEVQTMFLAASLFIYDVRSDEVPELTDEVPRLATSDGFFVLYSDPKLEREVEPFTLVNALYGYNVEEAIRLLIAAKWELPSNTEEQAWQFRAGRVADLGFPDAEDAARLFATPPKNAPPVDSVQPDNAATLPALYASPLVEDSLMCRAMSHITDPAAVARIENELVALVNAAVVAYGDSPRDLQHVADVATRVRDMLSLGLEVIGEEQSQSQKAVELDLIAAQALKQYPLRFLFQRAHHVVMPQHRTARALAQDPIIAAWLNITLSSDDDPERQDRAFLRALVRARPLISGEDPMHAERSRAWGSLADVAATQVRLDALSQRLL